MLLIIFSSSVVKIKDGKPNIQQFDQYICDKQKKCQKVTQSLVTINTKFEFTIFQF